VRTNATLAFLLGLTSVWAVGQTLRDSTWLSGLCFYVPSPFLAVVLMAAVLFFLAVGRRRSALLAFVLAVPPLGFVLCVENQLVRSESPPPPGPLRMVHWNVGRTLHRPGVRAFLADRQADVYILSEIPDAQSVERFCDDLGGNYRAEVFSNLAVIGRGRVVLLDRLMDRDGARAQLVSWEHDGHSLLLLVADLPSDIRVPRDPLLRELNEHIRRHGPDLVVGDLNAPRRSRALGELPLGYEHAYDSVGSGVGYTWPVPMPMYALDHCIHGPAVTPTHYTLLSSIHSDHRCQTLDFSLASVR
jgi:vancomycin resistance protein VanJ